ncbi:hypothetical protein Tco_1026145 [Tanacetum coccineum]
MDPLESIYKECNYHEGAMSHGELEDMLETTEHELDTLRARVVSVEQEIASLLAKARAAEQQDMISRARISELEHSALTWWNSYMKTVGIDAAYEMSWKELIKIMTKCFQELALLCLRMVPDEENKIKWYIWGLPDNIQRNVTFFHL